MPNIDWTAHEAGGVREILLAHVAHMSSQQARAQDTRDILVRELREIIAKLEAAYAND